MKKLFILFVAIVALCNASFAVTTSPIPDQVSNYVRSHFPNAKSIYWKKVGESYVVHFVNVKSEVSLYLNAKGELLDRVMEITAIKEIPDFIIGNINLSHVAYAEKFEGRNGELYYILEVKRKGEEMEEIIIDKDGKRVNEIVVEGMKYGQNEDEEKF